MAQFLTIPCRIDRLLKPGDNVNIVIDLNKKTLIKNVIFNDPATIVQWSDGTKTVVKCVNEPYDPEKGLAMAFVKGILGNKGAYYKLFKQWLPELESRALPEPEALRLTEQFSIEQLMGADTDGDNV